MFYNNQWTSRNTDRLRKVFNLANREACTLNHAWVSPEHVLLGMLKEGSGCACVVLCDLGIDLIQVQSQLLNRIEKGGDSIICMGKLPYTPQTIKVLSHAVEEANALGNNYIGTEHVLVGLAHIEDGVVFDVLSNYGLTVEKIRGGILSLVSKASRTSVIDNKLLGVGWGVDIVRYSFDYFVKE